jgi:hypothetical protein
VVAVIAGVGSGIAWLTEHVSDLAVWSAGWVLMVVLGLMWWSRGLSDTGNRRYVVYGGVTFVFVALEILYLDPRVSDYVSGYVFAAVALVPPAIEFTLRDRASRMRCLDCREEIRADANVCKHCGFRFRPRPDLSAVSTGDASGARNRPRASAASAGDEA